MQSLSILEPEHSKVYRNYIDSLRSLQLLKLDKISAHIIQVQYLLN